MAVVTISAGCPNVPREGFGCCKCTGECRRELTVEEKIVALRQEIDVLYRTHDTLETLGRAHLAKRRGAGPLSGSP